MARFNRFLSIAAVNALLFVLAMGIYRITSGVPFLLMTGLVTVLILVSSPMAMRSSVKKSDDSHQQNASSSERSISYSFLDDLAIAFVMPLIGHRKSSNSKADDINTDDVETHPTDDEE